MPKSSIQTEPNEEERRLVDAYNQAVAECLACFGKLINGRCTLPQADFLKVLRRAEHARIRCENSRLALEKYRQLTASSRP